MKGTILGLLTTLLLTGAVFGADGRALVEQQIAPGRARYIVVVERGAAQQTSAAITAMGGLVEADLGSRLVITIAPAVIDALRGRAGIRFIEKATLGSDEAMPDRLEPLTLEPRRMERRWLPVEPNAEQTWTTGDYAYDGSGNISGIGTAAAPGTQGYRTYTYDGVNRLTRAQISGVTPAATHEYGYDVYGNRTSYALNGQPVTLPAVSGTTNQLGDASYDSSGNQYSRGSTSATYDGFNMVTSYEFDGTNVETFVYTANDERIGVLRGTEWAWSLRGPDGKVLRQYRSSSTNPSAVWLWVEDFVYRNGMLLGSQRVAEEGGRRHYHLDHLGSARLVTSATGSIVSEHDFLPLGEERTSIGQHQAKGYDREEPLRFTGHERDFDNTAPNDSSSFIDYMHARYYATTSGRFLSVDPIIPSAAVRDPQRWNRYAYVSNNPIKNTDPTGKLLEVRASACSDSTDKCYTKLDAYQAVKDWVGKDAAKYLQLGKNGQVTLKGISAANFMKLGGAAAIVGNLIRSTSSTAALSLSANVSDNAGRSTPAFTRPDAKGTLTEINPAMFPRIEGGATQAMDTALAHDLGGHGLQDMWGISGLDKRYGSMDQRVTPFVPYGEAFAVTMENIYRASQGMDIRGYYINPGDYDPPKP